MKSEEETSDEDFTDEAFLLRHKDVSVVLSSHLVLFSHPPQSSRIGVLVPASPNEDTTLVGIDLYHLQCVETILILWNSDFERSSKSRPRLCSRSVVTYLLLFLCKFFQGEN